jgi:dTMP kinase
LFISFEGPDGAGKSTQAGLLAARLRQEGYRVVSVQEPGGTQLGLGIRSLLVRPEAAGPIDPRAEALLFSAARAQLISEVIQPALEGGAVVIADRFADSTLAYQGGGRQMPVDELRMLAAFATGGLLPDLTILLDLPPRVGLARCQFAAASGQNQPLAVNVEDPVLGVSWVEMPSTETWTRFESEALVFHERVRAAYLQLATGEPDRWILLDASAAAEAIQGQVLRAVWACLARGVHVRVTPVSSRLAP